MKPIVADPQLVACCGLYCGACGAYRRSKCPGCHENERATWCGVRTCCQQAGYASCADCSSLADPRDCKKFNHWIARLVGFVLRSDRRACILQIRREGLAGHARIMAAEGKQSIRRA